MRFALVTLAVTSACVPSGGGSTPEVPRPAGAPITEFTASRWVPAHPTYIVLAHSVADAQQAMRDAADGVGLAAGVDAQVVGKALGDALALNPLDPAQLADNGIDVYGGIAAFSEDIDPTIVVHLLSPEKLRAFFTSNRTASFAPRVVAVDGVEVSSASLGGGFAVSWAIDGEWLWVHFKLPGVADDGSWFTSSRHPNAAWAGDIAWARQVAGDNRHGVVGVIDLHGLVARGAAVLGLDPTSPAIACAQQALAVRRIGLATDADGKRAGARITVELAPGKGAELARELHAPTHGWADAVAKAPLAAQWNLDLASVGRSLTRCAPMLGDPFAALASFGVHSGRAVVMSIDPASIEHSTGAVELELTSPAFFARQLDRIPLRSHLESDVRFGSFAGKHLGIPFGPEIDYVLADHVAMAGLGDGMLARAIGRGPGAPTTTIASLDVLPSAMPTAAWDWLLARIDAPKPAWLAIAVQQWHDAHVMLSLERDTVIFDVHGERR